MIDERFMVQGKALNDDYKDDGEWVTGYYRAHPIYSDCGKCVKHHNHFIDGINGDCTYVDPATVEPVAVKVESLGESHFCPNCGRLYDCWIYKDTKPEQMPNYCDLCGQRLDWSES
ncbi:MAG: hypothetical protein FWB91_07955 [Defluviitaleaceae bacterium]|nr:hypothetical protein [Defluviitaleaceae bacterium]